MGEREIEERVVAEVCVDCKGAVLGCPHSAGQQYCEAYQQAAKKRRRTMERAKLEGVLAAHAAWLDDKKDGRRADLAGAYLANANLAGANLREADLWGADLREADLREADLRGANLRGADLRGANLRCADLWYAYLQKADLQKADLRGAVLRDANLRDANLKGVNLRYADLREANLVGANLVGANLRDANLGDARCPNCSLDEDCDFLLCNKTKPKTERRQTMTDQEIDDTRHAGDCTIYVGERDEARPWDGICTCGAGWRYLRQHEGSDRHMLAPWRRRRMEQEANE